MTEADSIDLRGLLVGRREEILAVARRHGVTRVRVFGSAARGDTHAGSDVDLLVDFEPGRSILDHARLWRELNDLLPVAVDVISSGGLKDRDERIRAEAVPL